ncbi:MAG: ribonuclease P protein component [Gammaproteobacteria bacterium]
MAASTFGWHQRLHSSAEIDRVFRRGTRTRSPTLITYALQNDRDFPRLGLSVSRKVSRLASRRNALKRRVRETFRSLQTKMQAVDVFIVILPQAALLSRHALIHEVAQALLSAADRKKRI